MCPQALEKSEWQIKNGQCRSTAKTSHTKHMTDTSNAKNSTQKTNKKSKTKPCKHGVNSTFPKG